MRKLFLTLILIIAFSPCFAQPVNDFEAREKLIKVCRILAHENLIQGFGHVSYRVSEDLIYITPFGPPGLLRPDELLVIDREGTVISGEGRTPGEVWIHLSVYDNYPEFKSVIHYHPEPVVAVVATGVEVKPMVNEAADLVHGTPIYDNPRLIRSEESGKAMAKAMAGHNIVLLRGHGAVVASEMPEKACYLAVHLVKAARVQIMAASLGSYRYHTLDEAEHQLVPGEELVGGALRFWGYYERLLFENRYPVSP